MSEFWFQLPNTFLWEKWKNLPEFKHKASTKKQYNK